MERHNHTDSVQRSLCRKTLEQLEISATGMSSRTWERFEYNDGYKMNRNISKNQ